MSIPYVWISPRLTKDYSLSLPTLRDLRGQAWFCFRSFPQWFSFPEDTQAYYVMVRKCRPKDDNYIEIIIDRPTIIAGLQWRVSGENDWRNFFYQPLRQVEKYIKKAGKFTVFVSLYYED